MNQLLLEIFHHLILSLRIVSKNDPVLNTERAAVDVLLGLERIMFSTDSIKMLSRPKAVLLAPRRVYPEGLAEFTSEFVFNEMGSEERLVRWYCRQLFLRLSSKVKGYLGPTDWLSKHGVAKDRLLAVLENLPLMLSQLSLDDFTTLHKRLVAAADTGEWLLANSLELPGNILGETNCLFDRIQQFLDFALVQPHIITVLSPTEKRRLSFMILECLYVVLKLVCTALETWDGQLPEHFVEDPLITTALRSLLTPAAFELEVLTDLMAAINIPSRVERLCMRASKIPRV